MPLFLVTCALALTASMLAVSGAFHLAGWRTGDRAFAAHGALLTSRTWVTLPIIEVVVAAMAVVGLASAAPGASTSMALTGGAGLGLAFVVYLSWARRRIPDAPCGCSPFGTTVGGRWSRLPGVVLGVVCIGGLLARTASAPPSLWSARADLGLALPLAPLAGATLGLVVLVLPSALHTPAATAAGSDGDR
jgi:hypothetical protein